MLYLQAIETLNPIVRDALSNEGLDLELFLLRVAITLSDDRNHADDLR
jgi:hypothetical protein